MPPSPASRQLWRQCAGLRSLHRQEHGIDAAFLLRGGLQARRLLADRFADIDALDDIAAMLGVALAERGDRAAHAVVGAGDDQRAPRVARDHVFGRGDAFVLRRQREAGAAGGRGDVAAIERQHRHGEAALAEHGADLVATQRAEHEIVALGRGLAVGGQRAAGGTGGVVEHDLGTAPAFAVITGEQAIAHRRGRGGEAAGQGQQHRQLDRRPIAVAIRGRAVAGIELPGALGRRRRSAGACGVPVGLTATVAQPATSSGQGECDDQRSQQRSISGWCASTSLGRVGRRSVGTG